MIGMLIELVIVGAMLAGMWKVFEKAGRPGWEGIVPIYNFYILTTKIIGRPVIWFVACLIPVVGLVPAAILCIDTAKCFGKSTGYGVGMLLLGFVFWPLLGFSDATYTHVAPVGIAGLPKGASAA